MYLQDLEVLKEIPGYKALLKAVIKSQMQMLVEQLSDQTGEECVILTASTSDGTLCHLGSGSGKDFLDGRDEIKSDFLRHCLKKLDNSRSTDIENTSKRPRYSDPNPARQASKNIGLHEQGPSQDFVPLYPTQSQASNSAGQWEPATMPPDYDTNSVRPVKMIPRKKRFKNTPVSHVERANEPVKTLEPSGVNVKVEDSTDEQGVGDFKQSYEIDRTGSDTDNLGPDSEKTLDKDIVIKQEVSDDDMEILGIEPGASADGFQSQTGSGMESYDQSFQQDNSFLGPVSSSSGDLSYTQTALLNPVPVPAANTRGSGTIKNLTHKAQSLHMAKVRKDSRKDSTVCNMSMYGSPTDSNHILQDIHEFPIKQFPCLVCGKKFSQRSDVKRHEVVHTGERFSCSFCPKQFSQKHSRNLHEKAHRVQQTGFINNIRP